MCRFRSGPCASWAADLHGPTLTFFGGGGLEGEGGGQVLSSTCHFAKRCPGGSQRPLRSERAEAGEGGREATSEAGARHGCFFSCSILTISANLG